MEAPDTRGAGGRAPRGRVATPGGKIMGLVSSPLQLISKTVKGLVGSSPSDGVNRPGAAAQPRPSPPVQHQQARPAVQQNPKVVEGPSSFSFPTLAGSSDSPPTNSLSRHAVPAAPSGKPREEVPGTARTAPLSSTAAPLSSGAPAAAARDFLSGWSPSKLASLNFFMNGAKSGADIARPAAPDPIPYASDQAATTVPSRPYFNLTSMLRAGPGGLLSRAGGPAGAGVTAASGSTGGAAAASRSARYNPYGRPNPLKPPRPGTGMPPPSLPPPSTTAAAAPGALPEASHTQQAADVQPSLSVATARLPPPNPRVAPAPSGKAPRALTAPGAVRLAPGQVAFSSGRTGTPLPKFGPMAAAGQGHQQQAAHTPGGFRPLVGAAGGKRQRDSPAASPLMASGIRNLSEFKRRRQGSSQQPRAVLAGLASRTPRDKTPIQADSDRTPGGVGSGGSGAAATPGPVPGSGVGGELPATETARKILETLDNFKRSGDNTPSIASAKPGAPPGSRTGPPTGSPFPGPYMPPLDRLDQNHYGGTPTPSITTGAAGFVCGATPSPSGNAASAAQTPGPRMVLEFQTPVTSPSLESLRRPDGAAGAAAAAKDVGAGTLPLSPIAVPLAAAATDRGASAGAALASTSATEVEARTRADAVAGPGPSVAAGSAVAPESTVTTPVLTFNFSTPAAPSDPKLRAAQAICAAHQAVAVSCSGSKVFSFGVASLGADAVASIGGTSPPGAGAGSKVACEVAKAAAVPLPDDDDDEAEEAAAATATPVVAPSVALDARPQAPTSVPSGGAKRVAFVEQPETVADKQKDADAPAKATAATAATPPPATPGGFFFSSNAGSTPFRSFGADTTPGTVAGDKTSGAGDKDNAATPPAFSFGAAPVAEGAAPTAFSFGQTATSTTFSFGDASKQPEAVPAGDAKKAEAAPAGDNAAADKAAPPLSFNFSPSPAVPETAPAAAPAPVFGQGTFGASAAAASGPSFTFGAASTAPSFGAAATTAPASAAASAPAAGTAPQTTMFTFGAPSPSFGSIAAPAASSTPAANASSSTPAMAFGVAPTASAPAAAPATGFTFGAPASSAPAASSAAPSALSTAAATGFTFGGTSTGVGATPPPASFGSPMPVQNPSSAPIFGVPQAAASAAGFGAGSFGAASGPATGFTFGAPAAGGSSGGAAPVTSGGFGAQTTSSNPASTFAFGAGASAPTFGASAPSPSFGAAPTQQPAFGAAAPSFGAAATANPFAAAAPSFAAPSSQPSFGTGASAPAFGASAAPAAPSPSFGGFGSSNGAAPAGGMFTFGGAPFGSTQPAPAAAPTFGQAAPSFGQPSQAPAPAFGAAPGGFGAPGGFAAAAPTFGGAQPAPAGDAGGGFSLGLGDPKDGRKRVKARRHGH